MIKAILIFIAYLLSCQIIYSQGFIIDHHSIQQFDQIPNQYKDSAASLRLIFMDRSVGGNIDSYLDCLASPWATAKSYCKHYDHRDSVYAVDPSEVFWAGIWNRSNWRYEYWPNNCSEDVNCFIDFIEPRIDSFDVMGCEFSYLAVTPGSKIADSINGFFGSKIGKNHASVYANFETNHPDKKIIWWTTSLARGIGTSESQAFNDQMRSYAIKNKIVLFDVADILSHDPKGLPCYDNRDGITYQTESNADDGLDILAICPQYTTETEGGHLGSISAGGIRVAKAFWVLMAKMAGWNEVTSNFDILNKSLITIYPNPATDYLNIHLEKNQADQDFKLSILDITGREQIARYITISNGNTVSIQINSLNPGIYILTFHSSYFTKIIKFSVVN